MSAFFHFYLCGRIAAEWLIKMKSSERNKQPVRFLQIHLTEHCNLNCKGCTHFSPLAKKEFLDLRNLETMLINLKPYLEKWFCRLELLGGEPLLHPDIETALALTRKYYNDFEVRLITNGLKLMHMPESFYKACADHHIIICMSMYPVNIDYPAIEAKLSLYGIAFRYYGEYETNKTFWQYRLNPKGIYDRDESYHLCKYAGHCFQLRDNRVFPCFISAYAHHLNAYFGLDFKWEDGDYIVLDHPVPDEDFVKLATASAPFCKYCNMEHQTVFEWDYSQKSMEEWIEPDP